MLEVHAPKKGGCMQVIKKLLHSSVTTQWHLIFHLKRIATIAILIQVVKETSEAKFSCQRLRRKRIDVIGWAIRETSSHPDRTPSAQQNFADAEDIN